MYEERYRQEKINADIWARYYLNLRLGSLTLLATLLGAMLSFGWIQGFQYQYEATSLQRKILRLLVVFSADTVAIVSVYLENEFRRRYDIAWQYAKQLERLLRIDDGIHMRVDSVDDPRKNVLRDAADVLYRLIGIFLGSVTVLEGYRFFRVLGGAQ